VVNNIACVQFIINKRKYFLCVFLCVCVVVLSNFICLQNWSLANNLCHWNGSKVAYHLPKNSADWKICPSPPLHCSICVLSTSFKTLHYVMQQQICQYIYQTCFTTHMYTMVDSFILSLPHLLNLPVFISHSPKLIRYFSTIETLTTHQTLSLQ